MGTLTSCSFMPLNSEFRSNPVRRAFNCHRLNRLSATSHFLFAHTHRKHFNFDNRFRCFAVSNNNNNSNSKDVVDGGEGESQSGGSNKDSKSNVTTTTALPEDDRGFNSEKSTTPSTSQRVHVFILIFLFTLIICNEHEAVCKP